MQSAALANLIEWSRSNWSYILKVFWESLVKEYYCRNALDLSRHLQQHLDCSLTLLLWQRSRTNKTATLNEHYVFSHQFLMAVTQILFIYWVNVNNDTRKNSLKQTKHQTKSQFVHKLGHVTKAAGIEVFLIPKNESALARTSRSVKDRSRKSGSIQERSLS